MVPVMQHYAIHILPVKALEDFDCELAKPESALISCVGTRVWVDVRTVPCRLILEFADTSDMHRPGAFSRTQAEEIARFARGLPNSVTDVFVCCSEGESRSPAVAAALLRASGRSEEYILYFADAKGKSYSARVPEDLWNKYSRDKSVELEVQGSRVLSIDGVRVDY